ncbi:MAG TPA: hypothetical protein DCP56_05710 [Spirochaetaceae bacterium]|nr:hypothetical protein [Spirochaetaceae bacterium]
MLTYSYMTYNSNKGSQKSHNQAEETLENLLDNAIAKDLCTGIAASVSIDGRLLWSHCSGFTAREELALSKPIENDGKTSNSIIAPIDPETRFDVASMTKPLSTSLLILKALQAGALNLQDSLGKYLPEVNYRTGQIPLLALLTHSSGLPAIPALHSFFADSGRLDRSLALERLFSIEPQFAIGKHVVYSCTGYIFLGALLERISGMLLGELFQKEIAAPLKLEQASFAKKIQKSGEPEHLDNAVATEYCPWRNRRIQGQVHDESSYCLGGHSGNAGLFLSLKDAITLGNFIMQEGTFGGKQILKPEIIQLLWREYTHGLEERRSLGFKLHDSTTVDGPLWPLQSFGHTGFVGTSVFFEPQRRLFAILLTNRVYFGREQTADSILAFRREFYSRVWHAFAE